MNTIAKPTHHRSAARQHRRAFTLLEMMLVIVIMGILATVAVVAVGGSGKRAKEGATKASLRTIDTAIAQFQLEKNRYPTALSELVPSYLQKATKDGWKREFNYSTPASNGKPYDVSSNGDDGLAGTADDISVWTMDDEPATPTN